MKQGKKLVKWSAYVIELGKHKTFLSSNEYRMINYANFLHQNLSDRYTINGFDTHPLNRFIPTDKEGNVLEKPECYDDWLKGDFPTPELMKKCKQYQEALGRVVFKGFEYEYNINGHYREFRLYYKGELIYINSQKLIKWGYITIEDLCELGLILTSSGENNFL